MKKNLYIFLAALLAFTFTSCREDAIETYSGENNVFFTLQRWSLAAEYEGRESNMTLEMEYRGKDHKYTWVNNRVAYDSLALVMFFYPDDVVRDTFLVPVSIMGYPENERRELKYEVLNSSTAQEGTHYRILDAYIPANATKGAIVVEVFKNAIPDNDVRQIDFRLLPNEHFFTNYRTVQRSRVDESLASALEFRLTMTNDVIMPAAWRDQYTYLESFGYFSPKKLLLLLELSRVNGSGFYPRTTSEAFSLTEVKTLGGLLSDYLDRQAQLGTPVYEDDGTLMTTKFID